MEVVNILLFYISYPIRNRGESYVREKLQKLMRGTWGNDRIIHRLASPPGPVRRLSDAELTRRVSHILRYGSGSVPAISPLASIRLVQFAHGVLRLVADQSLGRQDTQPFLQQVLVLDGQGIHGLQKVFRWVSQGMIAMRMGSAIIDEAFACDLHAATLCKQALSEAVLRIVHFRCFDTGKRFLMDAVHMLLRVAGQDLACRLLKVVTCLQEDREEATNAVAELMISWHCIVTMTTATFGCSESSKSFEDEISCERWSKNHPHAGDILLRAVACIKSHVNDVTLPARLQCKEQQVAPLGDPATLIQHDDDVVEILDDDSDRTSTALPYMYLRSVGIVPLEASASSSSNPASSRARRVEEDWAMQYSATSAGDPTKSGRMDAEGSRVWEYCWRQFKKNHKGSQYADLLPMFKPILLFSAYMARNMVAVNTFYHHEHIANALLRQVKATCGQWRRRRGGSHVRPTPLAFMEDL